MLIALSEALETPVSTLFLWKSPYLGWDYGDPETAVAGVELHAFEWLYVRIAPIVLIGAVAGIFLTRKRG